LTGVDVFQFKQFKVVQNKSVHRVGTDGVLLGAWADVKEVKNILDIGTGTGLIALMLAQRTDLKTTITAIEPEEASFELAKENSKNSPFGEKMKLIKTSIQNFKTTILFDLIVCNPPYFENSLKPPSEQRERQRHTDSLPIQDLIDASKQILGLKGRLSIVIPVEEGDRFVEHASNSGFNLVRQCAVFSKVSKPQERWLLELSLAENISPAQSSLTIMNTKGEWMKEYVSLTRDFYLWLNESDKAKNMSKE